MRSGTISQDDAVRTLALWRAHPEIYVRDVLGIDLWTKQIDLLRAGFFEPYTCCKSGHGTGKSLTVACLILSFLALNRPSRVIQTANTFEQVEDVVWPQVHKVYRGSRVPIGGELMHTALIMDRAGWIAKGVSTDNGDAFQGKHEENVLVLFDECNDIDPTVWDAAESLMVGENCHWVAISNPTRASGRFFDIFRDPKWRRLTISCLEHPNVVAGRDIIKGAVSRKWVDDKRAEWGENSPMFRARVLGEFPEEDAYTLISVALIEHAAKLKRTHVEAPHMGVDVARRNDFNVFCVTQDCRPIDVLKFKSYDLMEVAGAVQSTATKYGVPAENIHIDTIGLGAGVVDRCIEAGWQVEGVEFAGSPAYDWPELVSGDTKLRNRRAELYWVTRERLRRGDASVPDVLASGASGRGIQADLCAPTYKFDGQARILIEDKDEIRKRLKRSPDEGDAYVLSQSRTGASLGVWGA